MSNPFSRIKYEVPQHFLYDYPKFIRFIESYYGWLYRNGGFTRAETDLIRQEENWFKQDIQKYYDTGDVRYISKDDPNNQVLSLIGDGNKGNPGKQADAFYSDYVLERAFDFFETADGDRFETSDENLIEARHQNDYVISQWNKAFSFFDTTNSSVAVSVDQMMLIRLIRFFYDVKLSLIHI